MHKADLHSYTSNLQTYMRVNRTRLKTERETAHKPGVSRRYCCSYMPDSHHTNSLCARSNVGAVRIRPFLYGGEPAGRGKRGNIQGNVVPNTGGWRQVK